MSKIKKFGVVAIGLSILFFAPLMLFAPQQLFLFDLAGIYAILAASLALTLGFGGLLSLAHPVFFGIGAYFTGLALIAGFPFFPTLLISGLFAAVIATIIGFPSLRTRGVYFAITTLCLTIIFEMIANNWITLTGGDSGLGGIPRPRLIQYLGVNTDVFFHCLISSALVLAAFILYRITHSEAGRIIIAIRDQKDLSQLVGINILKYELINFCVGAFFAGIGGSLFAVYIRYVHPSDFGILQVFDILTMVVIGGATSITGPIIGAYFISFFPELIGIDPALKRVAYGIVLISVVIFMPGGLHGLLSKWVAKSRHEKTGTSKEKPYSPRH